MKRVPQNILSSRGVKGTTPSVRMYSPQLENHSINQLPVTW